MVVSSDDKLDILSKGSKFTTLEENGSKKSSLN
jgi:hypothetical protein